MPPLETSITVLRVRSKQQGRFLPEESISQAVRILFARVSGLFVKRIQCPKTNWVHKCSFLAFVYKSIQLICTLNADEVKGIL